MKRHVIKVCTKFERNRIIQDCVIDVIARFCRAILGGGTFLPSGSQGCEDIGRSLLHKNFVSQFGYIAAFSNAGGSKSNDVENDAKIRILTPLPPVNMRGEMGDISLPVVEAIPTTEPPEYIRWPSTARLLTVVD